MSSANIFAGIRPQNFNNNNQLTLLEYPNKNRIIKRNKLHDPFVMNNGKSNGTGKFIGKYMILAHGHILEPYTFRIPKNINFITLVKIGYDTPFDKIIDDSIEKLYKNGNTLFQKNDLGRKLTQEGKSLLEQLQSRFPDKGLEFRNHKGGTIANDMLLSFKRDSSTEGSIRGIGIKDLLKKSNQPKNITNLYNFSKQHQIQQILLSSLLSMYDEHMLRGRENINKVFIISACRSFQAEKWVGWNFAGEISRRSNSAPSY